MSKTAEEELAQIDELLYDASAEFCASEVRHQIDCHFDTIDLFVGRLAEHLRKINAVGEARREARDAAMEKKDG